MVSEPPPTSIRAAELLRPIWTLPMVTAAPLMWIPAPVAAVVVPEERWILTLPRLTVVAVALMVRLPESVEELVV